MTDPRLKIDPREEKLPLWVREKLDHMRRTIRDLEAVVASVKGEHEGSNVHLIDRASIKRTPLPKNSQVEFNSGWGKIGVYHDLDGRVCIQGDSTIILRVNAGNSVTVELES